MTELLPAIEPGTKGCLNCGPMHKTFPMDAVIGIGFGFAGVLKDNEIVWVEEDISGPYWTGQDAENTALQDPNHDWRIQIDGPLYSAHYQRQGDANWVLIYKDMGFA